MGAIRDIQMFQGQWAFAEYLQEIPKLVVFFFFFFLVFIQIYAVLPRGSLFSMHFSSWDVDVLHFVANKEAIKSKISL